MLLDPFDGLWPDTTIDIVAISTSSGVPEDTVIHSSLTATRSQKEIKERSGPFSEVHSKIVDVFYVSQVNGSLPAIEEKHFVRLNGVKRQIIHAVDQGGLGQTLEIMTERFR